MACGPAAVHDDEADAERGEQRELRRHLVEHLRLAHDVAAELDDEDLVPVGPDVAQRALEAGDAFGGVDASDPETPFAPPISSSSSARCACSRFSAWSTTTELGPSSTASSISTLRRTGRQCMTMPLPPRVDLTRRGVSRQSR